MKALQHFKTITYHKYLVMKGCFAVGLYRQGICHDLSKYSWTEFRVREQNIIRETEARTTRSGRILGILLHGCIIKDATGIITNTGWITARRALRAEWLRCRCRSKYVAEMLMDRIAQSKTYRGSAYKDSDPLAYYKNAKEPPFMHIQTRRQLEHLLTMLAEEGRGKDVRLCSQGLKKGRRADRHSS